MFHLIGQATALLFQNLETEVKTLLAQLGLKRCA